MISEDQVNVLDSCLEAVPIAVQLENKYFTKQDVLALAPDTTQFNFSSFKDFLNSHQKRWCSKCGDSFSLCDHGEGYVSEKIVYTLNPTAISEEVLDEARRSGPLDTIEEKEPSYGVYKCSAGFGTRRLHFEFFSEQDNFRMSDLDPFNLEFPVLLRDFGGEKQLDYRFSWRELLLNNFTGALSARVSDIKNSTTAVFAEYDERFVNDHRTEIKQALRDYFEKSGFNVYTEISERCPEIERYDIDAKYADYVCIDQDQQEDKILITHGEDRDGSWYAQRFIEGSLSSVEEEEVFRDLHDQINSKVRYYKSLSKQLSSSSKYMRGLGGVVIVVTALLTVVNISEITGIIQRFSNISDYTAALNFILLAVNMTLGILLAAMLFAPYIRERMFSWKMYPAGQSRPKLAIVQHLKYRID